MNSIFRILTIATCLTASAAQGEWTRTNGPYGGFVRAMVVIGSRFYAGTDDGLYFSADSGAHWKVGSADLNNSSIFALAFSGTNLFAGTYEQGVYISSDSGAHWTSANNGLTTTLIYALAFCGQNLFAGGGNGLYRSTNNGQNWSPVDIGLPSYTVASLTVNCGNMYAGVLGSHVCISIDSGASWQVTNFSGGNGPQSLAVVGATIVAGTDFGVFVSTNGGINWMPPAVTNKQIRSLHTSGTNIFAGTDKGIFLSTDVGLNWSEIDSGITNPSALSFVTIDKASTLDPMVMVSLFPRTLARVGRLQAMA